MSLLDYEAAANALYQRITNRTLNTIDPMAGAWRRWATSALDAGSVRLRALLEDAPRVWVCETHRAGQPERDGGPFEDKCYEWWIGEYNPEDPPLSPCRMVERILLPVSLVEEE